MTDKILIKKSLKINNHFFYYYFDMLFLSEFKGTKNLFFFFDIVSIAS